MRFFIFGLFTTKGFNRYVKEARQVLRANWTGAYTRPSPSLYPHQWNWDSAFIAVGNAHNDQKKARQELKSLFARQWPNGMVPHIVFNPGVLVTTSLSRISGRCPMEGSQAGLPCHPFMRRPVGTSMKVPGTEMRPRIFSISCIQSSWPSIVISNAKEIPIYPGLFTSDIRGSRDWTTHLPGINP